MSKTDTSNDNEKVRKIINKLYLAEIAFDRDDDQLAKSLCYDSLCQLADYYEPDEQRLSYTTDRF